MIVRTGGKSGKPRRPGGELTIPQARHGPMASPLSSSPEESDEDGGSPGRKRPSRSRALVTRFTAYEYRFQLCGCRIFTADGPAGSGVIHLPCVVLSVRNWKLVRLSSESNCSPGK